MFTMDTENKTEVVVEKYSDSRRDAIKIIRSKTIEEASAGGNNQRINLLAYAFLKGYAYEQIESKTNADQHCPIGQATAYSWLADSVARCISNICSDPITYLEVRDWIDKRVKIFNQSKVV